MKKLLSLALLLTLALGFGACSKDDDATLEVLGVWTSRSQFEGLARNSAVSFTIGDKAYVGLGTDGIDKFTDFWEYNRTTNTWRQRADFPGVGRYLAVAFAADGKGYVGTGYDGVNKLKDFWQYDPSTDQWTRKADFGGSARYKKDFWQYDPATNQWTQKPSFGGNKRMGASAFSIGTTGYLLLGADNGVFQTDIWSYDPATELWTQHKDLVYHDDDNDDLDYDYSALPRQNAASFVIGERGFVALGSSSGAKVDCWEYSPSADTWTQKTAFAGAGRTFPVGFALGDRGYVSLGTAGSTRLDDTWELAPDAENE
jgi:N-acetylneuraminic acid mutarotase